MGYLQTESAKQEAIVQKLIAAIKDHEAALTNLETARSNWMNNFVAKGKIGTPESKKASDGFQSALRTEIDASKKLRELEKQRNEQASKMMDYVDKKATFHNLKATKPDEYKKRKQELKAYLENIYK